MENRNTQRIYKMIMLVLIVIIVTSLVTAFTTYQYLSNNGISYSKVNTTSLEGLEYTLSQFRSELEKKYIGDEKKSLEISDILKTHKIIYFSGAIALICYSLFFGGINVITWWRYLQNL